MYKSYLQSVRFSDGINCFLKIILLIRCRNCCSGISHNITKHRALNKQDFPGGYWKIATTGAVQSGFGILFDKLEAVKGKQRLNMVDRRDDGGHDFT